MESGKVEKKEEKIEPSATHETVTVHEVAHETTQTTATTVQESDRSIMDWISTPNEINGFFGAFFAILLSVITWWYKHKYRDSIMNKAEGNLYQQLATEQNRLIERIKLLEESKDLCVDELTNLKSSVYFLNELKEENLTIKQRIADRDALISARDAQISELHSRIEVKDKQIFDLTLRIHKLELQLSSIKQGFENGTEKLNN